jgi:adenosine deaminase
MEALEKIRKMPKVELHVHLEGSVRPETLLQLAQRNGVTLPATDLEGLRKWYQFSSFEHFVEIYVALSKCIRTAEDVELITRQFLAGQAEQNIVYSEATLTVWTLKRLAGIPLDDQLAAVNRAREWARQELGVEMGLIIDIIREESPEDGMAIAQWAVKNHGNGVVGLGLSGIEAKTNPAVHAKAFQLARDAGLPISCHAGETQGPWSIWSCLNDLGADRIGHGVRCLEDPELVAHLRDQQIPLEVCPSSNVCLKVVNDWHSHPLRQLHEAGLTITLNSDDPPMFGTTLTQEFERAHLDQGIPLETLKDWTLQAAGSAFLPEAEKADLMTSIIAHS